MSRPATGRSGMVSSSHPLASAAGLKVLKAGGNAVDSAVATSLVLGVVAPAFSGIGGGGFMMVHLKDRDTLYIDYRETSPASATPDMFQLDEDGSPVGFANSMGHRSVGVPGTIAGLTFALDEYGTMSFKEVASSAIGIARGGFELSPLMGSVIANNIDNAAVKLRRSPESRGEWTRKGRAYRRGERKASKNLARAIELVAEEGREGFYEGWVADRIIDEMSGNGGLLADSDLLEYHVEVRRPVRGEYRGLEVLATPPPSLGGTALIQALNILEEMDLGGMGLNSAEYVSAVVRTLAVVWPDVRRQVGDPAMNPLDTERLTSKEYSAKLWFAQGERGAGDRERNCTTHLSVADKEGNFAAVTESLECYFGSGVMAPETGFFLNDTMHDFDASPGRVNSIAPGKRPASNMTPTLLLKDGAPFLVAGSPGGPRIVTATLQTILNVVDHSLDVQRAIDAPRFHYNGSGSVRVESRLKHSVRIGLRQMDIETETPNYLQLRPGYDVYFGGVNAILVGPGGSLKGGADSRRQGLACGY